jgi:hypothetical protein
MIPRPINVAARQPAAREEAQTLTGGEEMNTR